MEILKLKITIPEMKTSVNWLNTSEMSEERFSELKDRSIEISQSRNTEKIGGGN